MSSGHEARLKKVEAALRVQRRVGGTVRSAAGALAIVLIRDDPKSEPVAGV